LKKKPIERLGSKGADEIKKHDFFKDIDFVKLLKKEIEPPFVRFFFNFLKIPLIVRKYF
jgi:hypothetical protein